MSLDSYAFRFSSLPALLLDECGVVIAVNAALRELLGDHVDGLIGDLF
jgi:hypothetical protein